MTDEKKKRLTKEELEQLREELMATEGVLRITRIILVMSGKGGVGKSTVAVNLAVALADADRQVGLLDIDIHGPSIPTMLGLEGKTVDGTSERGLVPLDYGRLRVMSMDFMKGDQSREAVIWRGPMKHKMIERFVLQTHWGDLDYLIVDAPPGTGDEPLTILQTAPGRTSAIIVTTPQDAAVKNVKKSVRFCRHMEIPVFGIVENMSGFVCPDCGTTHDLFKSGGGEQLARETGFRFLGRIPLDPRMVTAADQGKPFIREYPESPAAKAFDRIVEPVLALSPPKLKRH